MATPRSGEADDKAQEQEHKDPKRDLQRERKLERRAWAGTMALDRRSRTGFKTYRLASSHRMRWRRHLQDGRPQRPDPRAECDQQRCDGDRSVL
jgi:hypothetical protein